jgi:hypothetical protein
MVKNRGAPIQHVYFVTTLQLEPENVKRSRCVGYFLKPADAFTCVEENWGDIYENGYYEYAVVEEVKPGIYSYPRKEWWYKWKKGVGYLETEKPEAMKRTVGFSVG